MSAYLRCFRSWICLIALPFTIECAFSQGNINGIRADVRAVVDLIKCAPILGNVSELKKFAPVLISSKGLIDESGGYYDGKAGQFVRVPSEREGLFIDGTLKVLNWVNLLSEVRVVPFSVRVSRVARVGDEGGPTYSPFIEGGMALCKADDLNGAVINKFPETYYFEKGWIEEIRDLSLQPLSGMDQKESALKSALLGMQTAQAAGLTAAKLTQLLEHGNRISRAVIIAVALNAGANDDNSTFVKQIISNKPSGDILDGISLGILAATEIGDLSRSDRDSFLQTLTANTDSHDGSAKYRSQILNILAPKKKH